MAGLLKQSQKLSGFGLVGCQQRSLSLWGEKEGGGPGATGQRRMLAGMSSRSFALSRMSDRDAKTIPNCRNRKGTWFTRAAQISAITDPGHGHGSSGCIRFFIHHLDAPCRKFLGPYGFPTVESWYPNRIWYTWGFYRTNTWIVAVAVGE